MARQNINNGTVANDGTGDTLRDAAGKINDNFAEIYQYLGQIDSSTLSSKITISDSATGAGAGYIRFEGANVDAHETTLVVVEPTGDRQIVFPNASGNVLLDSSTNTLTNKTLTSPIIGSGFSVRDSNNHDFNFVAANIAASRNVNLPILTDSDTFVFNAHTATLTNKTLTTPTVTSPTISGLSGAGVINDSSGNEVLVLTKTASAVNHINLTNNATNNNPKVEATGTDTNIDLELGAKGTGGVILNSPLISTVGTAVSGAGALPLTTHASIITNASDGTYTLADGVVAGQQKIVINTGNANATIQPSNFAAGTSVVLQHNETVSLVFDGTEWQVLATYGGAVS